jgi:8-oxo-dGTP pyrophosphatase MutT (NUDIX family)
VTPIPASSVLVARRPGSDEVFLVERSPALRFMGGMVAFPGGKVHEDDEAVARPAVGLTVRHVAAVRELFEETGVLLARLPDGSFPRPSADLDRFRTMLLDNAVLFSAMLEATGLHLDARDLAPAGHLVTPPFAPLRFDTAFFAATLPPGQEAAVWNGELTRGWWATAGDELRRWREASSLLTPPTVSILASIEGRPVADLPGRLRPLLAQLDQGRVPPIWIGPGVLMVPLDCQGLPPTTHTNTLLVGTGPVYLIDPGPVDAAEQAKLWEIADERKPAAILLSHHHPDHIGAAEEASRRYGVPVLAHRRTADLLRDKVRVDRAVEDGEELDLGDAPHAGPRAGAPGVLPARLPADARRRHALDAVVADHPPRRRRPGAVPRLAAAAEGVPDAAAAAGPRRADDEGGGGARRDDRPPGAARGAAGGGAAAAAADAGGAGAGPVPRLP